VIVPIVISMPLWITSGTEPDFPWLRGKLTAAGWSDKRAREFRGSIAVSFHIAVPAPPAGLSKRKAAAVLEAGETVWRSSGLSGDVLAGTLLKAMRLRPVQVARLHIEKVYTLGTAGRVDIKIEAL
jgi:hypothetical protein